MTKTFTTTCKPVMDEELYADLSAHLSNALIAQFDVLKEVCEAHPEVEHSRREKYFQYTLRRMVELGVDHQERVPGVRETCFGLGAERHLPLSPWQVPRLQASQMPAGGRTGPPLGAEAPARSAVDIV